MHNYLYTFRVRADKDAQGLTQWEYVEVEATDVVEAARKLERKLDDMVYINKVIINY